MALQITPIVRVLAAASARRRHDLDRDTLGDTLGQIDVVDAAAQGRCAAGVLTRARSTIIDVH
jgi:hypothetical protein